MNNLERFEATKLVEDAAFKEHIETTVSDLKKRTTLRRKTRVYKSVIDPYTNELFALHKAGCSIPQLHIRLRDLGVKVDASTVYRWAEKNGLKKKPRG